MPNPLIDQGLLNRLVASITWKNAPELNVTPSFLNRRMIALSRDGDATVALPSAVGVVLSPEPYLMVTLRIDLLKTQPLAAAYEKRLQTNSRLGNGTVRPDVTTGIGPFDILNCGIVSPGELTFSGEDATYPLTVRGYMPINSSLWP